MKTFRLCLWLYIQNWRSLALWDTFRLVSFEVCLDFTIACRHRSYWLLIHACRSKAVPDRIKWFSRALSTVQSDCDMREHNVCNRFRFSAYQTNSFRIFTWGPVSFLVNRCNHRLAPVLNTSFVCSCWFQGSWFEFDASSSATFLKKNGNNAANPAAWCRSRKTASWLSCRMNGWYIRA